MDISISAEELQQKKLFIAAPMYGGMCNGIFCRSTNDLSGILNHYGIQHAFYYLFNESLITRARNYCCDEFMRSDCTHMIFIDSDIGFDARDVVSMLAMMDEKDENNPYDILCAPYPKKTISWEKIVSAVNQGYADEDANNLDKYVGDFVFNPAGGGNTIALNEPAEVLESGTGFMMFTKNTLDTYKAAYPQLMYKPDHVRTANFDGSREIMCYFDALIDDKYNNVEAELKSYLEKNPDAEHKDILTFLHDKRAGYSNRYLSEDYMFCQWARKAGLKVWLCPWMKLAHAGSFVFGGSLTDLAQIGASATADPSKLKTKKMM